MKKIFAVILCLAMLAFTFAACTSAPPASSTAPPESAPAGTPSEETPVEPAPPSDLVEISWWLHGSNVSDDAAVMEQVNAYLAGYGFKLKPIWGTWGDFDTNVVLAINGGDPVDIYFTCSWSADEYNAFAKKGAFARLDDPDDNLLEQYAQDIWSILPETLKSGAAVNGDAGYGVYALPGFKDYAVQNCWDVNVDRLTELGFTLDDVKKGFDSFGDIFAAAKEKYGNDFYPFLIEGAVLERMVTNTIIVTGDAGSNNLLSYYLDPTDVSKAVTGKLVNKFATPEYEAFVTKVNEYYKAGYIDPAMANTSQANDARTAHQTAGTYLIGTQSYSFGYEVQASAERGIEVAMVPTTEAYVDTTGSQGAMMAISSASAHKADTMKFLNLVNTDPKLMTLIAYGIEGVHYNLNADGNVEFVTEERNKYTPWRNGLGNVTILPPQQGEADLAPGQDFWTVFKDYYASAKAIPALGWALDQTPVADEIGALANVAAEYALTLSTGAAEDPAASLAEFRQKLTDNGIDKVVEEANAQLEAFLAAKG
ncbi:MAG: ABC transporter substrate-binding protein [Oscillospiraceae bacterium]|jgi:putative aldouronate transport system substrate-binding protein|nr:ABC transporter substrate-binding protein [Oscillospiraceae bacterium]